MNVQNPIEAGSIVAFSAQFDDGSCTVKRVNEEEVFYPKEWENALDQVID